MFEGANEDALFDRLRRLVATAKSVRQPHDRRSVLSLQADIRALRAELDRRCAVLTEQMKDAGARATAITAYARTGSLARRTPHARQ
jgi:hypothetical protein